MNEIEAYVRQAAIQRGIDPDIAVRVVANEGGLKDPFQHGKGKAPRSQLAQYGPLENSYGPMQLYISGTGAGLGDRAIAAGIDPQKDWKAGVDFGLDEVARVGWDQWYGAKGQGITGMMGVNGRPGPKPGEATVADYRAGNVKPDQPVYVGTAPVAPVQETQPGSPASAVAMTTPAEKKGWRNALAKGMAGFKMPTTAKAATPAGLGEMTEPALNMRVAETPMFDPQQMADQRTQLAMAMQKLNSGKLWL